MSENEFNLVKLNFNGIYSHIYCGDCLVCLREIPDNSVHLIVTSPPYNVNVKYDNYSDNLKKDKYLDFSRKWLKECYRVLIKGGRIAVNLPSNLRAKNKTAIDFLSIRIFNLMEQIGFLKREWITWIKMPKGTPVVRSTAWGSWCSPTDPCLLNACEYIIVMSKIQHKRTDKRGKNDILPLDFLEYVRNCWYIPIKTNLEHPAIFPTELAKRLIKLYTWEHDTVLDPFVGSGTTLEAAILNNRNGIGIDISPKYCRYTHNRILAKVNALNFVHLEPNQQEPLEVGEEVIENPGKM